MTPTDDDLAALVGRRFPGGSATVDRWENWLLTDCTRREPMSSGLLHPVVMFHLPLRAADTSIAGLFDIVGIDGSPGSVTLLGYEWEYFAPLFEAVPYRGEGGVTTTERHCDDAGVVVHDDVTFAVELIAPDDGVAARSTIRWRIHR